MGLRDIIKEKKIKSKEDKEAKEIKKEKVIVKSKEEFFETCKAITKDFEGVFILKGEIDNEPYVVTLMLQKGDIIAATFKYLDLTLSGDEAIQAIKNKLRGLSGKLEIYKFEEGEISKAIRENQENLLKKPIHISELGMRIKYLLDSWEKERKESREPGIIPSLPEISPGKKTFNLFDISSRVETKGIKKRLTIYDKLSEDSKIAEQKQVPPKAVFPQMTQVSITEDIKKRREEKIQEVVSKLKGEKIEGEPKKKVVDGTKIKTPIDRLLEITRKKGCVKIDDTLAKALGVTKEQIEEWAVILEAHNLVELHYPALGVPEIRAVYKKREKF